MRRAVVVVLVALLACAGLASASSLGVTSSGITSVSASHPCPGGATAVATNGTVTVTLPSAACDGLTVQLTTLTSAGGSVASGSATVTGTVAAVPVATTGATAAAATVAGWPLTVTYAAASLGPVSPANQATVLTDVTWDLVSNNPTQACFHGTVTTTSATPVEWALTIDLSVAPFNGVSHNTLQLAGVDGWRYRIGPNQPSPGFAQVEGTNNGGRRTIVAGQSYRVDVCDWSLPAGVDTPSAYTVTTAPSPTQWTTTKACLDTTVTGNGTSQFYVGWTAQIDLAPAVARLAEGGNVRDAWAYGETEWMVTRTQTGPTTFTLASTAPSTVAGTGTFTVTTCAVDF
ncbi:hypothetical protein OEB99_11270 [Actinotalea sp. M2MS4P-6]|uniref:hypothetical protein n=1 Tax=Actinotalea sp. M2MS4P-6 TaxID=2983762 RepID=UPI0021E498AF|nr:hypothetical protein [Actinotalea sp. M2MS4P-6]MCV2394891.1 hypothetical protein [Actinotalea sp. M2MS4P-6]